MKKVQTQNVEHVLVNFRGMGLNQLQMALLVLYSSLHLYICTCNVLIHFYFFIDWAFYVRTYLKAPQSFEDKIKTKICQQGPFFFLSLFFRWHRPPRTILNRPKDAPSNRASEERERECVCVWAHVGVCGCGCGRERMRVKVRERETKQSVWAINKRFLLFCFLIFLRRVL